MKSFRKILLGFVLLLIGAVCPIIMAACDKNPDGLSLYHGFKTNYYWGEKLDVTDGIIKCVNEGKETYIALTEEMVSAFQTDTVGTREMIISANGFTLKVKYSVSYYRTISLYSTFKTTYVIGDEIDLTGGKIKCLEQDPTYTPEEGEEISNPLGLILKESIIDITNDMIPNFSTKTKGRKTMTLNYKGCALNIDYSVVLGRIQPDYYYMSDTLKPTTMASNNDDFGIFLILDSRQDKMCCGVFAKSSIEQIGTGIYNVVQRHTSYFDNMEEVIDQDGNIKYYLTGYLYANKDDAEKTEVSIVIEMTGKNTFKVSQSCNYYEDVEGGHLYLDSQNNDTYTLYQPV